MRLISPLLSGRTGQCPISQDISPFRRRRDTFDYAPAWLCSCGPSAFRFRGALADKAAANLYSLSALTSFGHADIRLEKHWQLMGALESLNEWILFGLSTAYLFGLVERMWLQDDQVVEEKTPSRRTKRTKLEPSGLVSSTKT